MKPLSVLLGALLALVSFACAADCNPTPPPVTPPPVTGCVSSAAAVQAFVNVKQGPSLAQFQASTADRAFAAPNAAAAPFPWFGNRAVTLAVNSGQVVSLPFTVPASLSRTYAGRFGAFDTNYMGNPPFPALGGASYSVSTCPGSFNVPAACKAQWTGADGAYLTITGPGIPDAAGNYCHLSPGTVYYLNVQTATLAGAPKCGGSTCAVSLSYSVLQH